MRLLRRVVNISVLFSALVLTPLLFFAHFNTYLAGLLGDFAGRYLPNSTLLASERKAHREFRDKTTSQASQRSRRQAKLRNDMSSRKKAALGKGKRILVRGSAATAIGVVPVLGVSADIYSLSEDFSDVCELLQIIDDMSASIGISGDSLYQQNYCHKPEEGMAAVREAAQDFEWPWEG